MASSILKKLGSVVGDPEQEATSIASKMKTIDDYKKATSAPAPKQEETPTDSPSDKVNQGEYGSMPGEKRIDTSSMLKPLPSYDRGTPYVPEDQIAQLHEGEAVVPKEENPYAQAQPLGQMANAETGEEVHTDTNVAPQPTAMKSFGGVATTPKQEEEAPAAPDPMKEIEKQRAVIHQDKQEAAKTGDLVGLGKALINEKLLNQSEPMKAAMDAVANVNPAMPTYTGKADLGKGPGQDQAKADYETKLRAYDQHIQAALDAGTPDGAIEAGHLEQAKLTYQKQHPYGSAVNHPGVLGKIEHGLSVAGNIAGNALIPGVMPSIPGSQANIASKMAGAEEQVKEGEEQKLQASEAHKNLIPPVGKTPQEQTFYDLMHNGPNGGPQVNPDTQKPYTTQEANVASQGTSKGPEELYIQDQMKKVNPETQQPFTREEAEKDYLTMKAGTKPVNEKQRAIADYMLAQGWEDTPENRDKARVAIESRDVNAKSEAALPWAKKKAEFNNKLATERALLVQGNANAYSRGLKADELQQTENVRSNKVLSQIKTAQDALSAADHEQFAASIAPVLALFSETNAAGIKRVNKVELDKFSPANGSFGRWAEAHADKFFSGDIPDEYKNEVGSMLGSLAKNEQDEHVANTHSIDTTVRQGAQQPEQKPEGGVKPTPHHSTQQSAPAAGGFAAWKKSQQPK
jgi:hypothetical protein